MAIEKRFLLNPAQERNLRKWSRAELLSQAFSVVIPLVMPCSRESVRSALKNLAQMHSALRSRIAYQPDGTATQEIRSIDEILADLEVGVNGMAGRSVTSAGHWSAQDVDPEERAFRCSLLVEDDIVIAVRLLVSHMFTDGIGKDVLVRDFMRLLQGFPTGLPSPRQPDFYSRDALAGKVLENTEYWKELLSNTPRSCTYAATQRDEYEDVRLASVELGHEQSSSIAMAANRLRITQYALWSAAVSGLVQAVTGQYVHVFRSTYANRFDAKDADVVAQLAQAVFIPVHGDRADTMVERANNLLSLTLSTYKRGVYDANILLDWLNQQPALRGAIFQPAFAINYLPAPVSHLAVNKPETAGGRSSAPRVSSQRARVDPFEARPDLAIQVAAPSRGDRGSIVRLWARKPVYLQRTSLDLLNDLLGIVRIICEAPHTKIEDLPIERFESVASLCGGHHSGVAFDSDAMRKLLLQVPGVYHCELSVRHGIIVANVRVRDDMKAESKVSDMLKALHLKQPWFSGSIVPDVISLS
jgi:hypothetical protein